MSDLVHVSEFCRWPAQVKGPSRSRKGPFLLTRLLTAALAGVRYRAGEDVCGFGELVADHMGIHAECDGRLGVPEPGGDHMDRDASQEQGRSVDMAKIVQPGMGKRIVWFAAILPRCWRTIRPLRQTGPSHDDQGHAGGCTGLATAVSVECRVGRGIRRRQPLPMGAPMV